MFVTLKIGIYEYTVELKGDAKKIRQALLVVKEKYRVALPENLDEIPEFTGKNSGKVYGIDDDFPDEVVVVHLRIR